MAHSKATQYVAAALFVISTVALGWALLPPHPPFDATPHRALGVAAAEEVLRMQSGGGGRILLIDRDPRLFQDRATAAHLRAFHETLAKSGQCAALTNFIKIDPNRLMAVPPGDFFELLRRTKSNDIVISFLGPPMLTSEQVQMLKGGQARVLAFCPGNVPQQSNLARLFAMNAVQVAIVDQAHPVTTAAKSESPRAAFDRLYRIVTPETGGELGSPKTARP